MNDDIKIVDNFLPIIQQKEFCKFLKDKDFCWNYINDADGLISNINDSKDQDVTSYDQFISLLNRKEHEYWFDVFEKSIDKHFNIKVKNIIRMRLVLSMPHPNLQNFSYGIPHIDFPIPHKTLIYYGINSDGKTVLFKEFFDKNLDFSKKSVETMIEPKQGRAVLFNGLRYHTVQPFSQHNRFLLNFNFTD